MSTTITEIENKIFNNRQKIIRADQEIKQLLPLLVDAYLTEKGLVKGTTRVRDRAGNEYIVDGFYTTETGVYLNGAWLTGYKIKKDGTPGQRLTTIYSGWEICK